MQAINFKNMFGVETRDNKGSELTWAEMDQNLKMLSMTGFVSDYSAMDQKKIGEKLILIQDTDFNLYSNVGIGAYGDTCTLNEKFELDIQAAFLELDNLSINEQLYIVIPFTYSATGEGSTGINPNLRYTDNLGNFWVGFNFYKFASLYNANTKPTSASPFISFDLSLDFNEGDQGLLIAQVYWD